MREESYINFRGGRGQGGGAGQGEGSGSIGGRFWITVKDVPKAGGKWWLDGQNTRKFGRGASCRWESGEVGRRRVEKPEKSRVVRRGNQLVGDRGREPVPHKERSLCGLPVGKVRVGR